MEAFSSSRLCSWGAWKLRRRDLGIVIAATRAGSYGEYVRPVRRVGEQFDLCRISNVS